MNKTYKEYKVIEKCLEPLYTEEKLNRYAREGWKVVCSYYYGKWFVLERDIKACKRCGK